MNERKTMNENFAESIIKPLRIISIVLCVFSGSVFAQTTNAETKDSQTNVKSGKHEKVIRIAFVDPREILENAPQAEKALANMEAEFDDRRKEVIAMRDEIKALEQELASSPPNFDDTDLAVVITEKKIQLRDLRREYLRKQEELKEDISLRRNDEMARLQTVVRQTIYEIAEENKYDLILEQAVYVTDQVDITRLVLEHLKIKHKSNNDK